MHRLKKLALWMILGAAAIGFEPAVDGGSHALRAAGSDFLYLNIWGFEICWSDCAQGAVCCRLVYLVED